MGRKKKITVIEEPEDTNLGAAPVPTPAEMAEQEIEEQAELEEQIQTGEWLTEFKSKFTDQAAKIHVEKYDESGEWSICRKYPLSSFDPDTVRIEYGGGKYRCTLFDSNGKWVKGGRTYFKFADPIKTDIVERKPENPLDNPIVAMMMSAQKENANMLMGIMQSLLAAQSAGGAKTSGLSEIVEGIKAVNSMAPKEKPMESLKETLGLFKLVKEISADSGSDDKGGLLSDLKEVIAVLPLLKEHMASLKPAPAAPIAPGKVKEMDPLTKKIVELVPKFIGGAQSNSPAPEWGAYLLDIFEAEIFPIVYPMMKEKYKALIKDEDDAYDILIRYAKDPEERALALKQIPPLLPYGAWCNLVIDEAVRLAEADPEDAPAAGGGNAILQTVEINGADKKD